MGILKKIREVKRLEEENRELRRQLEGYKNWCEELQAEKGALTGSFFKLYQLIEEAQDITLLKDSADRVMKHHKENVGCAYRPDYIPYIP